MFETFSMTRVKRGNRQTIKEIVQKLSHGEYKKEITNAIVAAHVQEADSVSLEDMVRFSVKASPCDTLWLLYTNYRTSDTARGEKFADFIHAVLADEVVVSP